MTCAYIEDRGVRMCLHAASSLCPISFSSPPALPVHNAGVLCMFWQQYLAWSIRLRCKRLAPPRPKWPSCGRHGRALWTRPSHCATRSSTSWATTTAAMRVECGDRGRSSKTPATPSRWQPSLTCSATRSTSSGFCRSCVPASRISVALSVLRVDRSGPNAMVSVFVLCASSYMLKVTCQSFTQSLFQSFFFRVSGMNII